MPPADAAALLRRPPQRRTARTRDSVAVVSPTPPSVWRPDFVHRPGLVTRLVRSATTPLVIIVAPAGYGKTTLLAEWAAHDPRPFVWLAPAFVGPGADLVPDEEMGWGDDGTDRLVVIEDAHLLTPHRLRPLVEAILDDLGPGSGLALASRTELDLPMGRLRAHRRLLEVRMADLAMSTAAAHTLLGRAGCRLEDAAVATLVQRTGGWPAMLYLAGLSLGPQATIADVEDFDGDDHLIRQYLEDEVFTALPGRLRVLAEETAALDELSGELCDAVLGRPDTALALARLHRASQLLIPGQAAHGTYRWHPLVRAGLRTQLALAQPGTAAELQRRAADWCEDCGFPDQALAYACEARDADRAARLMWGGLGRRLLTGEAGRVRGWLEHFPATQLEQDPRLAVSAAHAALMSGAAAAAHRWFLSARTARASREPAWGRDGEDPLGAAVALVEAGLAPGGVAVMASAATEAARLAPEATPWRALAEWMSGVAAHLQGDPVSAEAHLDAAIASSATTWPVLSAAGLAQRIMLALARGELAAAVEAADEAVGLLEPLAAPIPATATVFAAAAAARAQAGRGDEAKVDLRCGLRLLAMAPDAPAWSAAQASMLMAHASLWLADVAGARGLLAQASRLSRRVPGASAFGPWFESAWEHMDSVAEMSLAGPCSLTIAELRVLRFLPSHRSFREIALQLGVSANTVKTQAHAVYRKLGVASRSEAVARAADAGLLGDR